MGGQMMGGMPGPNMGGNFPQSKFESFEHEFLMPPDIASINSEINKLNALTPFSDQYMPNAGGNNMNQADQLAMSGYSPSQLQLQQSGYRRQQQQQ